MAKKDLSEAAVFLLQVIEGHAAACQKLPESDQWRAGWKASSADMRDHTAVMDLQDALEALGWTRPSNYWRKPAVAPPAPDREDGR